MINIFKNNPLQQCGAVTIVISVILLVTMTLIIIFAANFGSLQNKMAANLSRSSQAFEAAEAGLEFGIQYLQQNSAAILASPVNGFIPSYSNSNTTNVSLANNSKFTITYSNPVAFNYTLILVSATGTNDDGTATRVVQQQVQFGSSLMSVPTRPITTQGDVSLNGSATITNTTSNSTIKSGNGIVIRGSASTKLSSGTSSTSSNLKSDVQQNVSSLQNMSANDFFSSYFGVSTATFKNNVAHYYSNNSSTSYNSSLNGLTGTTIWIDQTSGTANISSNTTIGSAASPVVLIVNGNLHLSGSATIYGFVYVIAGTADTDVTGSPKIIGGFATTGDIDFSGSSGVTYNSTVLTALQNSTNFYAKVPGSWKDF